MIDGCVIVLDRKTDKTTILFEKHFDFSEELLGKVLKGND